MDQVARETILNELREGASASIACGVANVHPGVYAEWIRKGKLDVQVESQYGQFFLDVQQARANYEKQLVGEIKAAPQWQSKRFLLENLYPETWSPKQRLELTGLNGGPITTRELDGLTDDQLWRLVNGESYDEVIQDGNPQQ